MPESSTTANPSPRAALEVLQEGNRRWATGGTERPGQSIGRREALVGGQSPFAVILSCVDSRVPPELVFDRGLGDLLVVRSAAHCLDDIVLGSVEFGPLHFGTRLILVLGHRGCGAATAAVEAFQDDRWPPGHLEDVIEALRPAYKMAMKEPGEDLVNRVVRAHTVLTVARLRRERTFATLLASDVLDIVGGWYDLGSGAVDIIC